MTGKSKFIPAPQFSGHVFPETGSDIQVPRFASFCFHFMFFTAVNKDHI